MDKKVELLQGLQRLQGTDRPKSAMRDFTHLIPELKLSDESVIPRLA
jgi:hypothetical protein